VRNAEGNTFTVASSGKRCLFTALSSRPGASAKSVSAAAAAAEAEGEDFSG